jgi:uncharacterized protein YdaU (DUF1376 family)
MAPKKPLFISYCPKDILTATGPMSPIMELAYRRILDWIYETGDHLPDDDYVLAEMSRAGDKWPEVKQQLVWSGRLVFRDEPCGDSTIRLVSNERCQKEIKKARANQAQKAEAAKASADARAKRCGAVAEAPVATNVHAFVMPDVSAGAAAVAQAPLGEPVGNQAKAKEPGSSANDSVNAKNGGNTKVSTNDKAAVHTVVHTVVATDATTGEQANRELSIDSDLFVSTQRSGAPAPKASALPDPKQSVWELGKAILLQSGTSKAEAGSIVGRWRKQLGNDDGRLLSILAACQRENAVKPVEWVSRAISNALGASNDVLAETMPLIQDF